MIFNQIFKILWSILSKDNSKKRPNNVLPLTSFSWYDRHFCG